ncbi:unnamed protein product, partial [Owenia fusiformis]
ESQKNMASNSTSTTSNTPTTVNTPTEVETATEDIFILDQVLELGPGISISYWNVIIISVLLVTLILAIVALITACLRGNGSEGATKNNSNMSYQQGGPPRSRENRPRRVHPQGGKGSYIQ